MGSLSFPIIAIHALPLQGTTGCMRHSPLRHSDQHPVSQATQPCLPLTYSPSWITHRPLSVAGQLGCSSRISSLGNSVLFNYLAGGTSVFSLISWQQTRTHPSFSFSQRRSTSSHSRGPVKSSKLSVCAKRKPAAPCRNSPAQRLSTSEEDYVRAGRALTVL